MKKNKKDENEEGEKDTKEADRKNNKKAENEKDEITKKKKPLERWKEEQRLGNSMHNVNKVKVYIGT